MTATNGAARVFSGEKVLSLKVVRLSLIVSLLALANPAQAAVVKKPQASKPVQKFDLKRITAAAAKAPQANSNKSIASIAGTSSLSSSAEIEKQFQQLKKNGFKGNPSIELLERMMGEMHNQKRWADKEIVMHANVVAYEKHYGADHPVVASQLESMIDMYKKLNKLSDASKLQTRVNSILKGARENVDATPLFDVHPDGSTTERSPMTHEDRMTDLRARADVFANHADFETSVAYLKKALSESKSEGGGFTSDDYKNLASFEERLGNEKEAAKFRNAADTTN